MRIIDRVLFRDKRPEELSREELLEALEQALQRVAKLEGGDPRDHQYGNRITIIGLGR